jgi:streptogramin lyase
MAYGFGSIWIAGARTIERLSTTTMRRMATVPTTTSYVDITTGLGSVWLADDEGRAIVRLDPRRTAVVRTYRLRGAPFGVASGAGAAWATSDDGTIARIDPVGDDIELIAVGGAPRSLVVGGKAVWVSID